MKYYTWKLKWELNSATGNLEGTDPTTIINNESVRAEPQFATGDLQDSNTLTYVYLLKGEIDPEQLTDWSVTEITANEMLTAAQTFEPEATLENGFIKFPVRESNTP